MADEKKIQKKKDLDGKSDSEVLGLKILSTREMKIRYSGSSSTPTGPTVGSCIIVPERKAPLFVRFLS